MTTEEVYNQVVKPLPLSERLRLATMILNDIPPQAVVDKDFLVLDRVWSKVPDVPEDEIEHDIAVAIDEVRSAKSQKREK